MSWDEFTPKAGTADDRSAASDAAEEAERSTPQRRRVSSRFRIFTVWLAGLSLGAAGAWAGLTVAADLRAAPFAVGDAALRFVSGRFGVRNSSGDTSVVSAVRLVVVSVSLVNRGDEPLMVGYLRCEADGPDGPGLRKPFRLHPVRDDAVGRDLLTAVMDELTEATADGSPVEEAEAGAVLTGMLHSGPRELAPGRARHVVFAGIAGEFALANWVRRASHTRRPDFEPEVAPTVKIVQPAGVPPTQVVLEHFSGGPIAPTVRTRLRGRLAKPDRNFPADRATY